LSEKLRNAVLHSAQPLTLVVQADKAVPWEMLLRLGIVARDAGISDAMMATLPREMASPAAPASP